MKKIIEIFEKTVHKWRYDDGITYSAALSFMILMSFPALILFVISISSFFLKEKVIQESIIHFISPIATQSTINLLHIIFQHIPNTNIITFSLLISFILFLWISTNLFLQLQKTINIMWGVSHEEKSWYEKAIGKRKTALITVLVFTFFVFMVTIFELIFSTVLPEIGQILPISSWTVQALTSILNFIIVSLFLAYLYRVLPDIKMEYKFIIPSSFLTAGLMTLGKYVFSIYLMHANPTGLYGSIGFLIAIFLWVFFISVIVTIMIEFTKIYEEYDYMHKL